jgi:hypothetical protein
MELPIIDYPALKPIAIQSIETSLFNFKLATRA